MSFYAIYPASISSNPSVGTAGQTAPTSATEVAGVNPSGNLQPLQTDAAGFLKVNLASTSGAANPLPVTDAAAEASLASIDAKTPGVGQKTMAASSPVVIALDQSAIPISAASLPLPAGAATSANQTTAQTSLNAIQASDASIDSKTPVLGQALAAASTPVVLTASQVSTLTPLSTVGLNAGTNTIGSVKVTDGTNTVVVSSSGSILVSGLTPVGAAPALNPLSVSGVDQAGNKQHLKQVTGTNALIVDGSAVTQPVSMASAPLPAGSATAAKQDTGNVSLNSIDIKTPALGQALAAASAPVVLTAAQITTLTPLSSVGLNAGANTIGSVKLTDGTNTAIVTTGGSILVSGAAAVGSAPTLNPVSIAGIDQAGNKQHLKQVTGTNALIVDGSAVTQPVSMASAPLATGAATSALQTSGNASLTSIDTKTPALGQAAMVASQPVTIASNQSALPLANQTDVGATGNLTALNSAVTIATNGAQTTIFELGGTWVGTVTFQGSNNAFSTFQAVATVNLSAAAPQSATTTANGFYSVITAGFAQIRAIMTAYTSGTATIVANVSAGQRVAVVLQGVAANLQATVTQAGKSKANAPVRNDYSSVNVTTSAYVQLIAATTSAANLVELFDSSGQTLVFAVGGAGSEVDQFYINPGGNGQVALSVPAGSRVSIKAVTALANAGYINLNLYT